jgi:hypothetical protein
METAMLQILATIFFSIGAIAAVGAMLGEVTEHWERMAEALGLTDPKAPLPRRRRVRIRPARMAARTTLRPMLRVAA